MCFRFMNLTKYANMKALKKQLVFSLVHIMHNIGHTTRVEEKTYSHINK